MLTPVPTAVEPLKDVTAATEIPDAPAKGIGNVNATADVAGTGTIHNGCVVPSVGAVTP